MTTVPTPPKTQHHQKIEMIKLDDDTVDVGKNHITSSPMIIYPQCLQSEVQHSIISQTANTTIVTIHHDAYSCGKILDSRLGFFGIISVGIRGDGGTITNTIGGDACH
jgi:hypothetical protein